MGGNIEQTQYIEVNGKSMKLDIKIQILLKPI